MIVVLIADRLIDKPEFRNSLAICGFISFIAGFSIFVELLIIAAVLTFLILAQIIVDIFNN